MVMDQTYNCKEYANGNGPNVQLQGVRKWQWTKGTTARSTQMAMDQTYNCKEYANGTGPNVQLQGVRKW